jgi:YbgC/YbaW family acyl-CoA thioester hydrolase
MAYRFQVTRRVEFSDTDMEGIMHFSNFFRFMESAEHAFFRSLGYSTVLSSCGLDVCLPRVHAECDYFAPLRFEDEVQVDVLVQRKGSRSLTYQFRFWRGKGRWATEVARGSVTAVCAARQPDGSFKAVAIPRVIADKIEPAPSHLLAETPRSNPPKPASRSPTANGHPVKGAASTRRSRVRK